MNTFDQAQTRIRNILALDAVTCLGAGALMAFAAGPLATLTALDSDLLHLAGLALFPVAGLFFFMSRMAVLPRWLVQFAVIGNIAWVAGSLVVLMVGGGNVLGNLFVMAQALAVSVLSALEARDAFGSRAAAPAQ
jgi:hypothetical protein